MTTTERTAVLALIRSSREDIERINDALEGTKHPMDGFIGESLDRIHAGLQELEFWAKNERG